jgi:hypothetical protein
LQIQSTTWRLCAESLERNAERRCSEVRSVLDMVSETVSMETDFWRQRESGVKTECDSGQVDVVVDTEVATLSSAASQGEGEGSAVVAEAPQDVPVLAREAEHGLATVPVAPPAPNGDVQATLEVDHERKDGEEAAVEPAEQDEDGVVGGGSGMEVEVAVADDDNEEDNDDNDNDDANDDANDAEDDNDGDGDGNNDGGAMEVEIEGHPSRDSAFYRGLSDFCRAHALQAVEPTPLTVVTASNASALAKAINGAAGPPWLRDALALDVFPYLRHILAYEELRRAGSRRFLHYLADKTSIPEKQFALIGDGFNGATAGLLARAWSRGGSGSARFPCECRVCQDAKSRAKKSRSNAL